MCNFPSTGVLPDDEPKKAGTRAQTNEIGSKAGGAPFPVCTHSLSALSAADPVVLADKDDEYEAQPDSELSASDREADVHTRPSIRRGAAGNIEKI